MIYVYKSYETTKMSVVDDAVLLKMAEAEILGEVKRAAVRHSIAGISGWQPCPKPNKMFLTNTLLQTIASNRIIEKNKKNKGEINVKCKRNNRKLLQKNSKSDISTNYVYQKPKKGIEKHTFSSKSSKHIKSNSEIRTKDIHSKNIKKKFSNKNIKLKKFN